MQYGYIRSIPEDAEILSEVTELCGSIRQKLRNVQKWTIIGIRSSRPFPSLARSQPWSTSSHGVESRTGGENACAGRLKWRHPRTFALSGFLPSPSSAFFPPLWLARRDSHGRPFRYSFVSWRLPSCPLTILLHRCPSLSPSAAIFFSPSLGEPLVLSLSLSLAPSSSFHCRASGPYVRHSCGIAPSLGIVLLPCPTFVEKYGPPKVFRLVFAHSEDVSLKSVHNICIEHFTRFLNA